MNENSNMNVNALMMALGKSFNSYSSSSSTASSNDNSTKVIEIDLIVKDCLTSIICEKIMNNMKNKHRFTDGGMDDFLYQIIRYVYT